MPVAIRSVAQDNVSFGTNTAYITVPKPAGMIDGDFLLAYIGVGSGSASQITAPTGWTFLRRVDSGSSCSLAVYYKFAQGEPAGGWSWSFSAAANSNVAFVLDYTGVDASAPIDAENGTAASTSATPSVPTLVSSIGSTVLVTAMDVPNANTITSPTNYSVRANKAQTSDSLIVADTVISASGTVPAATFSIGSGGSVSCLDALVLRPSVGTTLSVEQVRQGLKANFPPGADQLYDWDATTDDMYLLTVAAAGILKAYGSDYVDLCRREFAPLSTVVKLPEWEGVLGIQFSSASAANAWTATRQAAILGKIRESGADTLANIRAAIEPLLGYTGANVGTLVVLEATRSSLTTSHTFTSSVTSSQTVGASGSYTWLIWVPDGDAVSVAGIQLNLTVTSTAADNATVTVLGPTGTNGQANVTFGIGSLTKGTVTNQLNYLYEKATSAGKSVFGTWQVTLTAGAAAVTVTSGVNLFIDAVATTTNPATLQETGAAVFEWGVFADPTKTVNPDYVGVLRAVQRLTPAYARGSLARGSATVNPGSAPAIPDDPASIPDQCIPG